MVFQLFFKFASVVIVFYGNPCDVRMDTNTTLCLSFPYPRGNAIELNNFRCTLDSDFH